MSILLLIPSTSNQSSKIESENATNSQKINDLKINLKNIKEKIKFFLDQSNENQKQIQDKENLFLDEKTINQEKNEADETQKQQALDHLENNIKKIIEDNKDINYIQTTLNSKINKNKESIKVLEKEIKNIVGQNKQHESKMKELDTKVNKQLKESINEKFNGTKEQKRKNYDLKLAEDDNDISKLFQKKIDSLFKLIIINDKLIRFKEQEIQNLNIENDSFTKQETENKEKIKINKMNLKVSNEKKNRLIKEIKVLEKKFKKKQKLIITRS